MSGSDLTADELVLPIKRTDGETLEERLTANAYHNILPARYLRKDAEGNLTETQEELFERVARNIALAEAVFEALRGTDVATVTEVDRRTRLPGRRVLTLPAKLRELDEAEVAGRALEEMQVRRDGTPVPAQKVDGVAHLFQKDLDDLVEILRADIVAQLRHLVPVNERRHRAQLREPIGPHLSGGACCEGKWLEMRKLKLSH